MVKGQGQRFSAASSRLISLLFHIRSSYQLLSLLFHDNWASHSRDTILPWRLKVKVKDTPVSAPSSWLIFLVFHIMASYPLPSLLFHDNRASHSWDTIWPWKFNVKGQGQRYSSQHSIQLTHFLSVSHQDILSTPVPFVPSQSGFPFPRYNWTLKNQGQRSRSKSIGPFLRYGK